MKSYFLRLYSLNFFTGFFKSVFHFQRQAYRRSSKVEGNFFLFCTVVKSINSKWHLGIKKSWQYSLDKGRYYFVELTLNSIVVKYSLIVLEGGVDFFSYLVHRKTKINPFKVDCYDLFCHVYVLPVQKVVTPFIKWVTI